MNLDIHLTTGCNMKCSFCGAWEQDIDCSTMENTYVYHALEEGKKYGYKVVTLTGGEPLLHRDIKNIIQYASKLGYWVCITTNGLAIDREIIDVVKSNKCILRVSLHTLHADLHNAMTGGNSFDTVVGNIEKLKENGVYYGLGMTVFEDNKSEIPQMAKFAWEQKGAFIRYTPVVNIRQGKNLRCDEQVYTEMLYSICKTAVHNMPLLEYRRNPNIRGKDMLDTMLTRQCAAGSRMFVILDTEKNIVPCSFIEQKFELYEKDFEAAKDFDRMKNRMENVFADMGELGLKGTCKTCAFSKTCRGGCLANKLSVNLNPNDQQPICYRKVVYQVLSHFTEKEQEKLADYWTYHYLKKCVGVEKNKVCFRRLPIWELNFKPGSYFYAENENFKIPEL